jgi:RNA polymerase sigma-70 factor (ECF subfamily)
MGDIMTETRLESQFLAHRDLLLSFIYSLTRDLDVAEEVFQEVSLAILQEARNGTRVDNYMAWAREVARRRIAEYFRTRSKDASRRLPESMDELVDQAFAEHQPVLEAHETQLTHLLECLKRIAGRSRQVVEGFYRQRKSVKDIAAAIGWNPNSVKVALSRARKALAECIENRMNVRREVGTMPDRTTPS